MSRSRPPDIAPQHMPLSPWGLLATCWGIGGVVLLLGRAIWRLAPVAFDALSSQQMSLFHWVICAFWILFMAISEGYRGFQKNFSPRVVARAVHLAQHPNPLHLLLAPAFCMGLFHATRRRLITSWVLLSVIVVLVVSVRFLGQPWRGIVDAGVVVGLVWGLVAIGAYVLTASIGSGLRTNPETPNRADALPVPVADVQ